ncbi:MAG: TonB-dependent receptor [Pseudomonadota bacterium]
MALQNTIQRHLIRGTLLASAAIGLGALDTISVAAQDEDVFAGIETIMVTANRREENLQQAPIAISAFDGESITKLGFTEVEDLAQQTPSLQFNTEFGTTKPAVFLRGIGTNDRSITATPSVALYSDQVLVGLQTGQTFQLFDLERIEVLRGPQGTLYGRNTTGGAINFIARKPSGDFAANIIATTGRFGRIELEGGIDIPVIEDVLKMRATVAYRTNNGDQFNLFNNDNINVQESFSGRLITVFTPNEDQEWTLNLNFGVADSDGLVYHWSRAQGLNANGTPNGAFFPDDGLNGGANSVFPVIGLPPVYEAPDDFYTVSVNPAQNFEDVEAYNASLTGDVQFGDLTLTSVTAFSYAQSDSSFDSDGSPLDLIQVKYADDGWAISQELRLTSDDSNDFSWIGGVFFYHDDVDADNNFDIGRFSRQPPFGRGPDPSDPTAPINIGQQLTQQQTSYAAFGSASYRLTEDTKVTAGLRYTRDRKQIDYFTFGDEAVQFPLITNDILLSVGKVLDETFEAVTGNIIIDHRFTDDIFAYASYNRGFKSGTFASVALFDPNTFATVDGESVNAFEVGLKTQLFDQRVIFNVAAFRNSFSDLQVSNLLPDPNTGVPITTLANAADATIQGVEWELTARPIPDLFINFAGSYVDAKYDDFIFTPDDPTTPQDETVNLSGNRLPSAPEWSLNGSVEYRFDGPYDSSIVPRVDFTYSGEVFFQSDNTVQGGAISRGAYTLINASLRIELEEQDATLTFWGRNIFDEQFSPLVLPFPDFGFNISTRNNRRAWGATLAKYF